MKVRRLLALAPHTDDTELGCGGTIARTVEEGSDVLVACFSMAEASVPPDLPRDTLKQEFLAAAPRLGLQSGQVRAYGFPVRRLNEHRQELLEEMIRLRREFSPEMVLLPSGSDLHQDHQIVHAEGVRAFKDVTVWGYELPWNHVHFAAQAFVLLEPRHLEAKWQALEAYKSQQRLGRPYFARSFIEGLARVRGTQVRAPLAEAYEVVRVRW